MAQWQPPAHLAAIFLLLGLPAGVDGPARGRHFDAHADVPPKRTGAAMPAKCPPQPTISAAARFDADREFQDIFGPRRQRLASSARPRLIRLRRQYCHATPPRCKPMPPGLPRPPSPRRRAATTVSHNTGRPAPTCRETGGVIFRAPYYTSTLFRPPRRHGMPCAHAHRQRA